jgi:hypothetical protein
MATDGSSNASEAARLRELAQKYRGLAANVTDPATISAMRQMADDYEADADELDAYTPKDNQQAAVQPSAMAAPMRYSGSGCFLEPLLRRPILNHGMALALILAAITVPTLLRASVSGFVPGTEFLAYVPFAFLAALLLRPWAAASVAIGSALAADFFFMEPRFQLATGVGDLFGMGVFLVFCGMTICLVRAFRLILSSPASGQFVAS